jgi:hypothetical protein
MAEPGSSTPRWVQIIGDYSGGDQGLAAAGGQSVVTALSKIPGWSELRAVRAPSGIAVVRMAL